MANILIEGVECEGVHVRTDKSNILLLRGRRGFLGCGYFDLVTANRLGEAFVIVRGVKTFDDMLRASAAQVSMAASEIGIREGMSGREVMALLNREP
jgi:uncharacterized protein YunC (DUF1805 family)